MIDGSVLHFQSDSWMQGSTRSSFGNTDLGSYSGMHNGSYSKTHAKRKLFENGNLKCGARHRHDIECDRFLTCQWLLWVLPQHMSTARLLHIIGCMVAKTHQDVGWRFTGSAKQTLEDTNYLFEFQTDLLAHVVMKYTKGVEGRLLTVATRIPRILVLPRVHTNFPHVTATCCPWFANSCLKKVKRTWVSSQK